MSGTDELHEYPRNRQSLDNFNFSFELEQRHIRILSPPLRHGCRSNIFNKVTNVLVFVQIFSLIFFDIRFF